MLDTIDSLLKQEDTDGDKKITIEDKGPRTFTISSEEKNIEIKGTYQLSNLLQELVLAKTAGQHEMVLDLNRIEEPPVDRISRMIRDYYWNGLTRSMDAAGIEKLISDSKNESLTSEKLPVYVPYDDDLALKYYTHLESSLSIQSVQLPKNITPEFVKSLNENPGILSLKLSESDEEIIASPFVVPGGRFNEMYGWDSYFESVGLIIDGKIELAKSMADNFQYEIEYYGKILNANRSYYLTRTQPPFYSSLIREVFDVTKDLNWLESHLRTAVKEYETVWMVPGERLTSNGLNIYLAEGIGMPPECEKGHFDAVLLPFAIQRGLELDEFIQKYDNGYIRVPELDLYFMHDRSVRESGHDTSYRIDGNCADLNLVELQAMLFRYETDFAYLIKTYFNDSFNGQDSAYWEEMAKSRKEVVNELMWNEDEGLYFDYDHKNQQRSTFESATGLTPLWAGMCSKEQAELTINKGLPRFIEKGGIAASTEKSRGEIGDARPQRQWDYPNGWAPHQMMIWKGLKDYGFEQELQELVYRWLYMITRNAVDYNGTIPEKYDVVAATHKVFAEYGNVGTEFEYITQEGFGWMNASFQYGLSLLKRELRNKLNELTEPQYIFK